jgi:hypothetical protein
MFSAQSFISLGIQHIIDEDGRTKPTIYKINSSVRGIATPRLLCSELIHIPGNGCALLRKQSHAIINHTKQMQLEGPIRKERYIPRF